MPLESYILYMRIFIFDLLPYIDILSEYLLSVAKNFTFCSLEIESLNFSLILHYYYLGVVLYFSNSLTDLFSSAFNLIDKASFIHKCY